MTKRELVLASGSIYRARIMTKAGIEVTIDAPEVDERSIDDLFDPADPAAHALRLAHMKADAVTVRHPRAIVIAADQLGIIDDSEGVTILHKQQTREAAIDQLMRMSGTAHSLINGVVVVDTESGERRSGINVMTVVMRNYDRKLAASYVDRFEPFDTAGSYRMEDEDLMDPAERLLERIEGEDLSGVKGMPLPLLRRLLESL